MRHIYRIISLIALSAWLSLTVVAAWALDLTGTWEGTQVCEYFDGKPRIRTFPHDVVTISHTGHDLFFFTPVVGGIFHAQVIEDAQLPAQKAQMIFVECATTEASTYQELGRATTLRVSARGSSTLFEATSNFFQVNPEGFRFMGTCLWSYRRVNTIDPGVGECPAAASAVSAPPTGRPTP